VCKYTTLPGSVMCDHDWQGHLQSQRINTLKFKSVTISEIIFMIRNFSFRSGMPRHETARFFQSSSYCFYIHIGVAHYNAQVNNDLHMIVISKYFARSPCCYYFTVYKNKLKSQFQKDDSGQGPVEDSCEHGNEPPGSINC
jgi:hypothetical protein